jgi:hypothetical protein
MRAAALIEREEMLIDEFRLVGEASYRRRARTSKQSFPTYVAVSNFWVSRAHFPCPDRRP